MCWYFFSLSVTPRRTYKNIECQLPTRVYSLSIPHTQNIFTLALSIHIFSPHRYIYTKIYIIIYDVCVCVCCVPSSPFTIVRRARIKEFHISILFDAYEKGMKYWATCGQPSFCHLHNYIQQIHSIYMYVLSRNVYSHKLLYVLCSFALTTERNHCPMTFTLRGCGAGAKK